MHETKLAETKTELQEYLTFPSGWDGYAGKTFSPHLIATASALAEQLATKFGDKLEDLIPGPASDGSIDLEFRTKDTTLIVTLYDGEAPVYVSVTGSNIERLSEFSL